VTFIAIARYLEPEFDYGYFIILFGRDGVMAIFPNFDLILNR